MKKVVLITGASSGIGLDTLRLFAEAGYKVYGAARNVAPIEQLAHPDMVGLKMDLTDSAAVEAALKTIIEQEGRIDILVNNAGYGSFGPMEEVPIEEAERQLRVNVLGAVRLCQAVAPVMRRQGGGRIVNTSSVAGRFTICFGGWYNASKYALEAVSNALRMELKPFGIDVVLIEPGGIKTNWGLIAAEHLRVAAADTVYESRAKRLAGIMEKGYGGRWLSNPKVVARTIFRASTVRRPKARYLCGRAARLIVFLNAVLPTRWLDRLQTGLIGKHYIN